MDTQEVKRFAVEFIRLLGLFLILTFVVAPAMTRVLDRICERFGFRVGATVMIGLIVVLLAIAAWVDR